MVWELDYTDGELEEAELSFFAQDDGGNVWHLGEYPEEYEEGEIVKHPLWLAGLEEALPGIHMPAEPALHTPSYAQGWGPAVGWDDRGDTYALGEHTCTEVDCYDDVLVAKEFSRSERGAFQLKYYAPGVGNVRVGLGRTERGGARGARADRTSSSSMPTGLARLARTPLRRKHARTT